MADSSLKPLAGKRVIVTRAEEQSKSVVEALRQEGAISVVLPMVAFAPPDDFRPLDDTIRNLGRYDWLFLTSQNALRALQERSQSLGLTLAKELEGVAVAAVGPATAQAARNAGLAVAYVATEHQGVALAEELAAQVKGKRVLLPRSDRANRDMVDSLNRLASLVSEVVAYKTIRPSEQEARQFERIVHQGAAAVLFFSPSAVHHFQEMVGPETFRSISLNAALVAVGPVTERALREAGVTRIIAAADTTALAVVAALSEYFAKSGSILPQGVKYG